MSCQLAPGTNTFPFPFSSFCSYLQIADLGTAAGGNLLPDAPGTFCIGFFEFGQGHRGPMIPYCPGAP
ncbi:unnamed protein product, partial [Staurois parvus]